MSTLVELHLETTHREGGMGHVLDLPGCHFRGDDRADILARAPIEVAGFLRWCRRHGLHGLGPTAERILADWPPESNRTPALEFRVVESLPGAPLWESGNPAALFARDRQALDDEAVRAHFRVVRAACEEVARAATRLGPGVLQARPAPDRRSLEETLTHIGDCLWWYCSRLSDELPEPGRDCPERGLARIGHLVPFAERWLLEFPRERRGDVIVPRRHPSRDPQEPWTHRKACRRQAEHVLGHLPGILRRSDGLAG